MTELSGPPEERVRAHDPPLSLHDVAGVLGVHYMTVYRYVRLGQLDATKIGPNWAVEPEALARFVARAGPGTAIGDVARASVDWSARFESRIVAGDRSGAWAVVEAALVAGYAASDVHLEMLVPALHRVGDAWAEGRVDVAVEHEATGIVREVLGRLSPRFSRRGRPRGTVVLGCAPGERHALAVTVVVDLMRGAGFSGVDLGADVPAVAFGSAAARADRLVAVGISATVPGSLGAVPAAVREVRRVSPGAKVLVGGQAVAGEEHALALGADAFATDGRAAVHEVEALLAG